MVLMTMIIMIIIIMTALKGAAQDFYNLLTAPPTVSDMNERPGRNGVQITCNTSNATGAICCVPGDTKGQFSYQISSNCIYFRSILLDELLTDHI